MSAILKNIQAAFGDVEAAPYTVVVQRGGYEEREYPAKRWACTSMSGPSRHELVTPMFRRLFCYISGRNEPNVRIDMTTPVTTLVEPAKPGSNKDHHHHQQQQKQKQEEEKQKPNATLEEEIDGDLGKMTSSTFTNGTSTSTSTSSSSSSSFTSTSSSSSSLPTYTMGFVVPASHQQDPPASSDKNIFIEDRPKLLVFVRRFSGYMDDEVVQREVKALHEALRSNGEEAGVDLSRYYVAGYDPPFKLLGRRNEVWVVKRVVTEAEEEEEERQNGCGGGFGAAVVSGEEDEMVDGMVLVSKSGDDDEVMLL